MAGLFSSGEQDMLGNIVQQRQQANQALGSGYGKYGGIVQAAGGLIDTGTDAMFGGKVGASDPRMQQMEGAKAIFAKVSKEMADVTSPAFYERLSVEFEGAGFPEQAEKAKIKAAELKKAKADAAPKDPTVDLLKTGKYTPESVKAAVEAKDFSLLKLVEKQADKTPLEKKMDLAGITDPAQRQSMAQKSLDLELKANQGDQTAVAALNLLAKQLDVQIAQQKVDKGNKAVSDAEAAKIRSNKAAAYKASSINNTIDTALSQVGGNTAGIGGAVMSRLAGSEAVDLNANLETITAVLGFDQLQAMRDASPTGGALGQVSERELIALQSTVASLRQDQSPAQLRANIEKVKKHYQNWIDTLNGINPDERDAKKANKGGSNAEDAALVQKYLKGK